MVASRDIRVVSDDGVDDTRALRGGLGKMDDANLVRELADGAGGRVGECRLAADLWNKKHARALPEGSTNPCAIAEYCKTFGRHDRVCIIINVKLRPGTM